MGNKAIVAWLIVSWAAATVAAFWVTEGHYVRPVPRPLGAANALTNPNMPKATRTLAADHQATLPLPHAFPRLPGDR
jgi:hypothetical protein